MFDLNPNIEVTDTFINMVTKIWHKCKVCGHKWHVTPHDLFRAGRARCPECAKWNSAKNREKQNYQVGQTLVDENRDITIINVRRTIKKMVKRYGNTNISVINAGLIVEHILRTE